MRNEVFAGFLHRLSAQNEDDILGVLKTGRDRRRYWIGIGGLISHPRLPDLKSFTNFDFTKMWPIVLKPAQFQPKEFDMSGSLVKEKCFAPRGQVRP